MANILSQEEINALLEILDEDEYEFISYDYKIASINDVVLEATSAILEHESFIKVDFQHYCRMKSELDNYKTTVFTKLFGKSIIVTIIGILFLSITASFNKGEFNSTMFISFLIIFSVVYLIVLNLLSHSSTAKFEKDKFGNNIIFK